MNQNTPTRIQTINSLRDNAAHIRLVTHGFPQVRLLALGDINSLLRAVLENRSLTSTELAQYIAEGERISVATENLCRF